MYKCDVYNNIYINNMCVTVHVHVCNVWCVSMNVNAFVYFCICMCGGVGLHVHKCICVENNVKHYLTSM